MIQKLKIVKVETDYCDYLRKYDKKVAYNMADKELRPFIGVLFKINKLEYFAPLSSPKPKHLKMKNTIDFFKIENGKLGAINFNNMIPIKKNYYKVIDVNEKKKTQKEEKYRELLKDQLNWLNKNHVQVKDKSLKLYNLYKNNKLSSNIKDRCCNFVLLEEKSNEYNKIKTKS